MAIILKENKLIEKINNKHYRCRKETDKFISDKFPNLLLISK